MWKPIADAYRKQIITQKVREVAEVLYESTFRNEPVGLLTGRLGVTLFLYQYWLWSKNEKYYEKAVDLLSESIVFFRINNEINSFCNGVAGLGWCLKYFEERDVIEGSVQEVMNEISPSLYSQMIDLMKSGKYDFLNGTLGIALCCYKIESESLFFDDLIHEMQRVSIKMDDGIAWFSTMSQKDIIHKVINLSLSHGLSGIISLFCKICHVRNVLPLLRESTKFLVNQQQDNTIYTSCFPSILSDTVNYRNSRLAWCYGDLGIAVSLLKASRTLNDQDYHDISMKVLLSCSERRDVNKEFVVDGGICHGSAGIAHIFNRVYQNSENDTFKDAALYWIDDCIRKSDFNDGLAGYKVWKRDGWITKTGLLEGIAGIGLVLISTISDLEPDWDECLMLS